VIDGDYGFIGNKIDNSSYSAINSGVKNRIFRAGDSSFINNVECSIIIDGDEDTIPKILYEQVLVILLHFGKMLLLITVMRRIFTAVHTRVLWKLPMCYY